MVKFFSFVPIILPVLSLGGKSHFFPLPLVIQFNIRQRHEDKVYKMIAIHSRKAFLCLLAD
uniref:Uncharacterized protein n=1 Tax=Anguilla anguilla TaxID=7936 RepID=A0A0E9UBR1_ANGAN